MKYKVDIEAVETIMGLEAGSKVNVQVNIHECKNREEAVELVTLLTSKVKFVVNEDYIESSNHGWFQLYKDEKYSCSSVAIHFPLKEEEECVAI